MGNVLLLQKSRASKLSNDWTTARGFQNSAPARAEEEPHLRADCQVSPGVFPAPTHWWEINQIKHTLRADQYTPTPHSGSDGNEDDK
ncbi:hypothetical protein PtA15_10A193 [Puccinia triticina]|nr:uncharacterized protein PtA15_10A193 [Puccinia triticina]WAQ88774.1 hypothetical protein PtA15_10A193 [Puccinia triticina]